ncbi:hypothetical protein BGX23_008332 [Mortierella sp. AD031]|nr:hypothetical protein BGX23_008332 [Mortierella sp. AD031]
MAQEFSHPSAVSATRSMVFTHQGPESLPLLQQQQQRLGGTLSRPPSIVESNDPQAWLPLQMLQQSLPPPPPSSKALVSSSAASSPSIKQTPSEERELIKEEDEGEEAYMRMDTVSIARYSSMSMNKQEEDEYVLESEQGHRSMETLLQQQHEMQVELQFLQQRQQVLQQEQFQREQALVRLSLQKNKRKQHRQQQQRSNHGSVPFF